MFGRVSEIVWTYYRNVSIDSCRMISASTVFEVAVLRYYSWSISNCNFKGQHILSNGYFLPFVRDYGYCMMRAR
jgi:hypothetical protein